MTADALVPCMASVVYAASFDTRPSHYDGRYDTSPVPKAAAGTCYRHLTVQRLALLCFIYACVALRPLRCGVCITGHAKQGCPHIPSCRDGGVCGRIRKRVAHVHKGLCICKSAGLPSPGTILHAVVHNTVQWALAGVGRMKPPEVPESSTIIGGNADPGFGPCISKAKGGHIAQITLTSNFVCVPCIRSRLTETLQDLFLRVRSKRRL